jgi:hypothetical protein
MNEQDRAQLELLRVELLGRLDRIEDTLAATRKVAEDHESRMRSVERWKLSIPISVLLAVATALGATLGR